MTARRFVFFIMGGLLALWLVSIIAIFWIGRGLATGGFSADRAASFSQSASGEPLPVLWEAPAFEYTDQNGRPVTSQSLRGHIWIADFIFTRCTTVCPMLSARMVMLQQDLKHPDLRFVSFSVDPEHDTPEVLKAYASRWDADDRWLLLSTDAQTLNQTAEGMGVAVAKSDDEKNPIIHSSLFLLVDAGGKVRGAYNSSDPSAMDQLAFDARSLVGATTGAVLSPDALIAGEGGPVDAGAQLFASLRCAACHEQPDLAPSLAGLFGQTVALEDGGAATADEAYLRESIIAPGAKQVAGYLPLMPSYGSQLSDEQVDYLVAYIRSLAGDERRPPSRDDEVATLAVDPVCGMQVRVAGETPRAEQGGQTYFFCNDSCREQFTEAPDQYLKP